MGDQYVVFHSLKGAKKFASHNNFAVVGLFVHGTQFRIWQGTKQNFARRLYHKTVFYTLILRKPKILIQS